MINDPVADMLTRIRNASIVQHNLTKIHYSKLNLKILQVLLDEGYIQNYFLKDTLIKKEINVILKYKGWLSKKPFFSTIKRISTPGQRIFSNYRDFDKKIDVLKYKQGLAIISTSSGIMSHFKSKKLKIGGEILCYIE